MTSTAVGSATVQAGSRSARGVTWALVVLWAPTLFSRESNVALPGFLGTQGAKVVEAIGLGFLALWMIRERWLPRPNAPMVLTLLYLGHAAFSGYWAVDADSFRPLFQRLAHNLIVAAALFVAIRSRADLDRTVLSWKILSVAVAALTAIEIFVPGWRLDGLSPEDVPDRPLSLEMASEAGVGEYDRASGPLGHSNWLGFFFGTTLLMQPYLWVRYPSRRARTVLLIGMSVELVALIMAHVRLGFVGVILGSSWLVLRGAFRYRLLPIVLLPGLALAMYPLLPDTFVRRVLDPRQYSSSHSASIRLDQQLQNLDLLRRHGWWGVGYGCFGAVYLDEATGQMAETIAASARNHLEPQIIGGHNAYIEVLIEQGVLGLVFFAGIFLAIGVGLYVVARRAFVDRLNAPLDAPLDAQLGRVLEAMLLSLLVMQGLLHAQEQRVMWTLVGVAAAFIALRRPPVRAKRAARTVAAPVPQH